MEVHWRKGYDNDCRTATTWAPKGGGVDLGEQRRRREKELGGGAEARCPLQPPTKLVGDSVEA